MERYRTLIVDDEEMIRNGVSRLVASCGEEWEVVATLSDGREALEFINCCKGKIDLLITDVKMPEMDGLTLINEIKKEYAFFCLVISGYEDFQYVKTAMREGAIDYLLKPIDRSQFRERMSEIKRKIIEQHDRNNRWREMEKKSELLRQSEQIQLLSYVTSAGIDITRLGYWVNEFPKGICGLIYFSLDALPVKARDYKAKDWAAFDYVVENIIKELMHITAKENVGDSWCWRGESTDFWAMIQLPITTDRGLINQIVEKAAIKIRAAIREYTPFTISVSVSEAIFDLYTLPDSITQARTLMNYRLMYGGNQFFSADLKRDTMYTGPVRDKEMYQIRNRLSQAIAQASEDNAVKAMRELFHKLEQQVDPVILQRCIQNIYFGIQMAGSESEMQEGVLEEGLRSIKRSPSLQAIKLIIEQVVKKRIQQVKALRLLESPGPLEQAKSLITDKLHEELSVKRIADHVFMNPTYFCRYFKMQTGETILDYITRMRIDKAKTLLADPVLKLHEISLLVGYQDVKYFSGLFKQWVGETPSQYRKHEYAKLELS